MKMASLRIGYFLVLSVGHNVPGVLRELDPKWKNCGGKIGGAR